MSVVSKSRENDAMVREEISNNGFEGRFFFFQAEDGIRDRFT